MFTGLIEAVAEIAAIAHGPQSAVLQLAVTWPDQIPTQLGESIAVNGCCLTVVRRDQQGEGELLRFELSHETLQCTSFSTASQGQYCNVERAMRLGDRLGGHLVTGHVDGTGRLVHIDARDGAWDVTYWIPAQLQAEIVVKGSIAIDGVSLTVNGTPADHLVVTLIPHTVAHTQLLEGAVGKLVHLETDLLAKHVRRLVQLGAQNG